MSAGLPALGLGGMFYLLLIVWMVLRELVRKVTGDNVCPSRSPFVGKMLIIALLMVLAAFGENLVIRNALELGVAFVPSLGKFVYTTSLSLAFFMLSHTVYSPPPARIGCEFLTPVNEPAAAAGRTCSLAAGCGTRVQCAACAKDSLVRNFRVSPIF